MIAALLLSCALLFWTGEAAECTDAQTVSAASTWAEAAENSACAPYLTQTNPVLVNAPCTATDCVAVVEGVARDLPDCTVSGINIKIEVQNALTACNGGDTRDAGSLVEATDAPSTSSSSSALTPAATTISMDSYCDTSEIIRMWDLYVATATGEECESDSVYNPGNIDIIAQCNSKCTEAIKTLANELPDCFYDFEYINKKQYVMNQLDGCDGGATSVSISLLPDNAVNYSSAASGFGSAAGFSSSSGSNAPMAGDSASGSEQLNSGDNQSDNTLDSSNVASGSNAAPPRDRNILPWVSLTAAIIVAFLN
ncbi:hypothetical protein L915_09188 [Phytophthora nicotianae]|uniref:Elicitin-like protein n=1 Tax=Phytophthora nicotianae TaxID=4792 RepID=W2GV49_PHYNI|nr:hypothetical protein L915_09188 [Phytophthora nicotianae]ETL39587.1 hypothetical protein L916_09101 [Phytophthora nicotianae]